MSKVELKKASIDDLPFAEKLLGSNGLPYQDISSKIDCLFVGYSGSRNVGIGGVEVYGDYGLLRSLVIDVSSRGKGYGRALSLKLIEYAKQVGIRDLYLLTITADSFFEKIGFERIHRDEAPEIIRKTSEFSKLCPSSSICMKMRIP